MLSLGYYVLVLGCRLLDLDAKFWSIDLDEAPSVPLCFGVLLVVAAFFVAAGCQIFQNREFKMKTAAG
jgi:hypothetical protein